MIGTRVGIFPSNYVCLEDLDVATNDKVESKQNPRTEDCSHNPEAIQTGPPTDSAYASATHAKLEHAQNARAEDHTQSTEDVHPRPPTDEEYASAANNTSEDAQNPKDQASDNINSTNIPSISSGLTLASYISSKEFVGAADEYGEGRFDHTKTMQQQVLLHDDGYIPPTNLGVIREFHSKSDKILRKLVSNASSSTVDNQETSDFTRNFHRTLEKVLSSASVNEHSLQDSPQPLILPWRVEDALDVTVNSSGKSTNVPIKRHPTVRNIDGGVEGSATGVTEVILRTRQSMGEQSSRDVDNTKQDDDSYSSHHSGYESTGQEDSLMGHDSGYGSSIQEGRPTLQTKLSLVGAGEMEQRETSSPQGCDEDVRSIVSVEDDISSQAATRRTPQEVTAEEQLGVLLARNEELKPLYEAALSTVGKERLVGNLRRLLKQYYLDLSKTAKTNLEKASAHLIRSRWSRIRIAQQISDLVAPENEDDLEQWAIEIQNKKADLEAWIAGHAGLAVPVDEVSEDHMDLVRDESSEEEEDEIANVLPNISEAENFLLGGYSFSRLSISFRAFLLPSTLSPLTRVLMSIPSDRIWFSDEDDNSILNKFKIIVEELTEENWHWWPLRPKMRMLQKGQTRVHWLCVSNSNLGNPRRKLIDTKALWRTLMG
jgi:hypothetical protein